MIDFPISSLLDLQTYDIFHCGKENSGYRCCVHQVRALLSFARGCGTDEDEVSSHIYGKFGLQSDVHLIELEWHRAICCSENVACSKQAAILGSPINLTVDITWNAKQ